MDGVDLARPYAGTFSRTNGSIIYTPEQRTHLTAIASLLPDWTDKQIEIGREMKKLAEENPLVLGAVLPECRAKARVDSTEYRRESFVEAHDFLLGCAADRHGLDTLRERLPASDCCYRWVEREAQRKNGAG